MCISVVRSMAGEIDTTGPATIDQTTLATHVARLVARTALIDVNARVRREDAMHHDRRHPRMHDMAAALILDGLSRVRGGEEAGEDGKSEQSIAEHG